MKARDVGGGRGEVEEDVGAGDQVDAGGDHRRRVDQRGDRGGALHRVGQPGVERELRRLGEGADQQQQADRGDRPLVGAKTSGAWAKTAPNSKVPSSRKIRKAASTRPMSPTTLITKAFIPAAGRGRPPVPEADQRVGGEADEGPADGQQDEVAGEDQQQHREDEEVEVAEEAVVALVGAHVAERVEVDQGRDAGDDEDHEDRERVDEDAELDVEPRRAGVVPERGGVVARLRLVAEQADQRRDAAERRRARSRAVPIAPAARAGIAR